MKFGLTRSCKACHQEDFYTFSKVEAAFHLYDLQDFWTRACSNCGARQAQSITYHTPKPDQELFDLWGKDAKLRFMDQDEGIILGEYENLPLLLKAIDEEKYLKEKMDVLIEAVCVILYDHSYPSHEFSEKEEEDRKHIAARIRPELIKRKERIKASESEIWEYVKEVVFPQLGLEFNIQPTD